jgi:AGZA family xanthine/uracil permease-like MFS transporter
MSYIIFVNSSFLADAGIPKEAAIAATILSSAFASVLMGLYANFPIALAPGMGLNAFFAYTIVQKMGIPWQTALGAVFISGCIFIFMTVTNLRQAIIKAIPNFLRSAIAVGIGFFISFIGFKNAGIVVSNPNTFVSLGNLTNPAVFVSIIGLAITSFLVVKKIKGAFLISIIFTTIIAMLFKIGGASFPTSLISAPPSVAPVFGHLDVIQAFGLGLINIIFCFTFVDMFDNIGTFTGVTRKAGMMDENGDVPGMDKALFCDAVASSAGAIIGTCTTTSYIESAAGIEEGGRTGLTAVTVGLLFLAALFFAPVVGSVPAVATAPILITVGMFMIEDITNINFKDFTEGFPAFLVIFLMPLTFSIAQGIAFGFTAYTIIKVLTGKYKEINLVMYVLTALFIVQFACFKHY